MPMPHREALSPYHPHHPMRVRPKVAMPCFLMENFLEESLRDELFNMVLTKEPFFTKSGTINNDLPARNSKIFTDFGKWYDIMKSKINLVMPRVKDILQLPNFTVSDIEVQITVHSDGGYYHVHNDNDGECNNRILTYVYYFNKMPKSFEGGELVIQKNGGIKVVPLDNSIIFFDAGLMHEVLETKVASKKFEDSRFTVNGWVRAGDWRKS